MYDNQMKIANDSRQGSFWNQRMKDSPERAGMGLSYYDCEREEKRLLAKAIAAEEEANYWKKILDETEDHSKTMETVETVSGGSA